MRILKTAFLSMLLGLCTGAAAEDVVLNPDHPDTYKVVRGDTLWDISSRFLRDPWRWTDVWDFNPQIANPHLIYPGDVIRLAYDAQGKVVIFKDRSESTQTRITEVEDLPGGTPVGPGGEVRGEVRTEEPFREDFSGDRVMIRSRSGNRLYPRIRRIEKDSAIPTIPVDVLQHFAARLMVVTQDDIENSGYIVQGHSDRLIAGLNDQVYARNLEAGRTNRFSIFRTGKVYRNPGADEDDILGYEALYIGSAVARTFGDPSTLTLVEAKREALLGDRLMPIYEDELGFHFIPRAPEILVEGQIIDIVDAVARIGQFQTAVLNLGTRDGLEPGHVLAVYHQGKEVRDIITPDPRDKVRIPDERAGLLMVFRAFEKVSYGLIMNSTRDISIYDMLRNP